ncbi:peptidase G2 autoproteolytic cleavage domain-containing protein [Phaeobacter gallaeciensis]|uniref:peptidase G2 autoproteolytic cleavage domain-containing protein n=1 Tax=Phaeobacter gallaeciensis TaxID=60890 RepID=UPI00237EFD75|nr:peptidase G2 autoproteolytic cleavage domain-containing protein [Phaeobacter gallaeciensis]MDE4189672.1 peptidase G2 autoproteolytic cleavage domain-containing protein [Phaeobacter gallaeciensis]MDE4198824.1 peptidase G2 autoproteolytic cleavage domain-containing protein [Phaeobacter gallaeciensis]MDE4202972.1 peptidase G2 autoproteolytic cleavage domain-containing protein [Phaeobacter gallaeciensis]MDE4207114.1 peptidase G2 autoproteolytic cleavage domain-containing protein [Phaeobacter gal
MSNDYFKNTAPLSRNSKARSAEMRSKIDAIAAGFDKLPGKSALEQNAVHYAVATGSANTYAAAMPATLTAYAAGQSFRLQIPATNTGASTLNVDSLGARAIKRLDGTDVEAGDLTSGDIVELIFNGTAMVLMGFYRSHMAGIAANLGADLVFSGNPAFTGAPRFNAATNKSTIRSDLGLGSIATQAADSVDINGGSVDGTPIGQSTPAAAAFTDLTASGTIAVGTTNPATYGGDLVVVGDVLGGESTVVVSNTNSSQFARFGINGDVAQIAWDNADQLALGTVASSDTPGIDNEFMRITGSGNVGFGTDAPDGTTHIHTASAGTVAADANADDLVVENGANTGVSLLAPDASVSSIFFGSPSDAVGARVAWSYADKEARFGSSTASGETVITYDNNADGVRVDSSGNVLVGTASSGTKMHVERATDGHVIYAANTHASFSNRIYQAATSRAGSSAFDIFRGLTNLSATADLEVRITGDGNATIDGSWTGGGADYAEYFEWALAHLDWLKEWKRQRKTAAGISVVLDAVEAEEVLSSTELRAKVEARVGGDQAAVDAVLARIATGKIHSYLYMFCDESGKARLPGFKLRPATWLDDPEDIIGVISANPSVVGDGDIDRWKDKYLRDAFGAYIWEEYDALRWTEVVTETETVQEQASEAQQRTREVVEVLNGQAVRKTVTETVQVLLFDELPLVDENGAPVMKQVQADMIDPVLDEDGNEVEPKRPIYESQQAIHREPRMVEVQKETTQEIERSYAADEVPDGVAVPADAERVTQQRRKLNPDYDPSQEYTPRADRPEWDTVGLMGKLRVLKGQPVGARWIKMRDVSAEVEEWLVR